MRILHTSDWHVGKVLKGVPRLEEHGAVLEEGRAQPALGAADELAAADLDLERAGAREAERGIRAQPPAGRHHLGAGAERVEAAHERACALRTQSRTKLSLPMMKPCYALLKKRRIPSPITTRNKIDS